MISFLEGKIVVSNEKESIILTNSGVGYKVQLREKFVEGLQQNLFISAIYKESGPELYGFKTYYEKRFFELLLSVQGVGPKSAFSLLSFSDVETICSSILNENKNFLKQANGIGLKAAAQIVLDLKNKVVPFLNEFSSDKTNVNASLKIEESYMLTEAVLACKELGIQEVEAYNLAKKFINENTILKTGELVQMILREIRS